MAQVIETAELLNLPLWNRWLLNFVFAATVLFTPILMLAEDFR